MCPWGDRDRLAEVLTSPSCCVQCRSISECYLGLPQETQVLLGAIGLLYLRLPLERMDLLKNPSFQSVGKNDIQSSAFMSDVHFLSSIALQNLLGSRKRSLLPNTIFSQSFLSICIKSFLLCITEVMFETV